MRFSIVFFFIFLYILFVSAGPIYSRDDNAAIKEEADIKAHALSLCFHDSSCYNGTIDSISPNDVDTSEVNVYDNEISIRSPVETRRAARERIARVTKDGLQVFMQNRRVQQGEAKQHSLEAIHTAIQAIETANGARFETYRRYLLGDHRFHPDLDRQLREGQENARKQYMRAKTAADTVRHRGKEILSVGMLNKEMWKRMGEHAPPLEPPLPVEVQPEAHRRRRLLLERVRRDRGAERRRPTILERLGIDGLAMDRGGRKRGAKGGSKKGNGRRPGPPRAASA